MDFTTYYCGPYYSDGRIQSSVENGINQPVNEIDTLCRDHDAEYNQALLFTGEQYYNAVTAADNKFYEKAIRLADPRGPLYGTLVKYGNKVLRKPKSMFMLPGLLGATIAAGVSNMVRSNAKLRGPDKPAHSASGNDNLDQGLVYTVDPNGSGSITGAVGKKPTIRSHETPRYNFPIPNNKVHSANEVVVDLPVQPYKIKTRKYRKKKKQKLREALQQIRKDEVANATHLLSFKPNPPKTKTKSQPSKTPKWLKTLKRKLR